MPCMMNGKPVPGIKGQCPTGSTWSENNMVNLVRSQEGRITQDYSEEDKTAYKKEKAESSKFKKVEDVINKNRLNQTKSMPQLMSNMNSNFISPNAQRRETFDAGINPMTGKKLPGAMTKMQQLGANLKNPEWWGQSMSGLKGDTRLSRLGVLMDYYGRTPNQRKAVDMPAKVFAANEAAAQKNKVEALAAQAKANNTAELYGKKTIADLTAELLPDVKEMFGDTLFGSWSSNPNASDVDAMTAIAGEVATNIKAISLAFPNKTPGEVRMLALQQVMKDRGLDDLR